MRTLRLFLAVGAVTFGGCLQSTTLIRVNGDGSGTIEHNMLLSGAALAQLRQFSAPGNNSKPVDPFSEDQARAAAASIGPSVTFVSSTPLKTEDGEGRSVVYAFSDINQITVNAQPPTPGGITARGSGVETAKRQDILFALTRLPNGDALIRITMPPPHIPASPAPGPDAESQVPRTMSPEQLAMAKQMFGGMKISLAVEPAGRLVSTTSPFVDGQRVTLMDLDFDQLVKDEGAFARLQGVHSVEDAKTALKDVPGVRIWLEREITIEFSPGQSF